MSITDEPPEVPTARQEDMQLSDILSESTETALLNENANSDHRMHLTLYYRQVVISEQEITNPFGMRLYCGSKPPSNDSLPHQLVEVVPLHAAPEENCTLNCSLPHSA